MELAQEEKAARLEQAVMESSAASVGLRWCALVENGRCLISRLFRSAVETTIIISAIRMRDIARPIIVIC